MESLHVISQSQATAAYRRLYFQTTAGATGAGRVSKNGAASAASTNNIVEVDSVNMPTMFYIELTATECNTLGYVSFMKNTTLVTAMIVPDSPQVAALTAADLALALLKYDFSGITGEAERSMLNAMRDGVNAWAIAAGVMTVKKEDDTTTSHTRNVTGTPSVTSMGGL